MTTSASEELPFSRDLATDVACYGQRHGMLANSDVAQPNSLGNLVSGPLDYKY